MAGAAASLRQDVAKAEFSHSRKKYQEDTVRKESFFLVGERGKKFSALEMRAASLIKEEREKRVRLLRSRPTSAFFFFP